MIEVDADNLYDLWVKGCLRCLRMPTKRIDVATSMWSATYDMVLTSPSMDFSGFDMGKHLWFTPQRWTKLQRDYLEPSEVPLFIDRCHQIFERHEKTGAIAMMPCKIARASTGRDLHRWGNCMIGISYRGGPKYTQPTFTLHSRASYIAVLGGLDIALVWAIAKELSRRTRFPVKNMAFRWHIDSVQWHAFKSLPFLASHELIDEVKRATATQHNAFITHKMVTAFEGRHRDEGADTIVYSALRRLVQLYHDWQDGALDRSTPIKGLRLNPRYLGGHE